MADWRQLIKKIVTDKATIFRFEESLAKYTTFRIGGKSECLVIVNNENDLLNILKLCQLRDIPVSTIGNGSKLLFSSQGLHGITLKLGDNFNYCYRENNKVIIGAATLLHKLCEFTYMQSLGGVEFLSGIPATFGGAIKCNVGAFSQDIGSCIMQISGIHSNGEKTTLTKDDMVFSYRHSNIPDDFIITEGIIELVPRPQQIIIENQSKYKKIRKNNQPWGFSVGSIFKNPIDLQNKQLPAGKLIDEVNLKGFQVGYAYISAKHANFIINKGEAHFNDVYELIQVMKSKVELKNNIILQEEVQILPKSMEVKKWLKQ